MPATITNTVTHRCKCMRGAKHPHVQTSVSLDAENVALGQTLEGGLKCTTSSSLHFRNLTVSVYARLRLVDHGLRPQCSRLLPLGTEPLATLLLGNDFMIEPGEHSYPFSLRIPSTSQLPTSFEGQWHAVVWHVAVTGRTTCCKESAVLGMTPIILLPAPYTPISSAPHTAAVESVTWPSGGMTRVDVRLKQSVQTTDSPVRVEVFVNNQADTVCRTVKVAYFQTFECLQPYTSPSYLKRSWAVDKSKRTVNIGPGQLQDFRFSLLARTDLSDSCLTVGRHVAPTTTGRMADTYAVAITYHIEVTVAHGPLGQKHTTVRIPLVLVPPKFTQSQTFTQRRATEQPINENECSAPQNGSLTGNVATVTPSTVVGEVQTSIDDCFSFEIADYPTDQSGAGDDEPHRENQPECSSSSNSRYRSLFGSFSQQKPPAYNDSPVLSRPLAVAAPELARHALMHQSPGTCPDCAQHALTFTLGSVKSSSWCSFPLRARASTGTTVGPLHSNSSGSIQSNGSNGSGGRASIFGMFGSGDDFKTHTWFGLEETVVSRRRCSFDAAAANSEGGSNSWVGSLYRRSRTRRSSSLSAAGAPPQGQIVPLAPSPLNQTHVAYADNTL